MRGLCCEGPLVRVVLPAIILGVTVFGAGVLWAAPPDAARIEELADLLPASPRGVGAWRAPRACAAAAPG